MKIDPNTYDVIVVGGGASGMMAAGRAAERGKSVLLLEKNAKLGEKLKITGGGRCNITNAEYNTRALLEKYGEADKFLHSPFSQFGVQETFDFFEQRGLPLIVQARKRAFPKTESAWDVFLVLEKYIRKHKVKVITNSVVTKIKTLDDTIAAVQCGKNEYYARSFIFATGGVSHPGTGSTGDGFRWLTKIGHSVTKSSPNIVPLRVKESWVKKLSGTSLSFMKINFFSNGKRQFSETGKILFTHFGISGPLILNSAHKVSDLLEGGEVTAVIDMFPDTDLGALERRILAVFEKNKNKMFKNVCDDIVPPGMSECITALIASEILPETPIHMVSKESRKVLVHLLKALPLTISGLMGFERAVVSDGGIHLAEVDTKTMRSKILKNLFVTGDLLNIRRPSGGYSLQLCWTTGFVAGSHCD